MANGKYFYLDTQKQWHEFEIPARHIGGGANSFVFPISADRAAKIYTAQSTAAEKLELLKKVSRMAFRFGALAAIEGLPLAWPLGPAFKEKNEIEEENFCGFVMPRVHNLFNLEDVIKDERLGSTEISGKDRIQIARRVAEMVGFCHDADFVIGDMNMRNIVVSGDTIKPTIIDCDSFQYKSFTSNSGTLDFASAEVLDRVEKNGGKFKGVAREKKDDCHALSVIIFMMLMNGRHPYDVDDRSVAMGALRSAIITRNFPYSSSSRAKPRTEKDRKRYEFLDDGLKELFERVLLRGEFVPADGWIAPLDHFATLPAAALITPTFGDTRPPPAPPPLPPPPEPPPKLSRTALWLLLIIALVILIIIIGNGMK